jgi:hypothetical protein
VELYLPDTISSSPTSKSGPTTFFPPDSSAILSSQQLKESSPTRNADRDTSEERLSDSSIDDLLESLFKKSSKNFFFLNSKSLQYLPFPSCVIKTLFSNYWIVPLGFQGKLRPITTSDVFFKG